MAEHNHRRRGRVAHEKRRTEAGQRLKTSSEMSPGERLALLDQRLGEGVGAESERRRLEGLLNENRAGNV